MKRILVIGLCVIIAIGTIGCSNNQNVTTEKESIVSGEEVGAPDVMFFGKIKNIVGNEVEVEIAKDPYMGGDGVIVSGEDFGSSSESVSGEVGDMGEGEMIEAVTMTGAIEATEGEVMLEMAEQEKLELEYVDDVRNFIIPTGVKIFNLTNGKDETVASLKNGSVIRIYASGTQDSPTVLNIDIVE